VLSLKRTTSSDGDLLDLVRMLDADLAVRDGKDHAFFAQYNKLDEIMHAVVAYFDHVPAGCGAVKKYDEETMEVKRMYVKPEFRGKGIARKILTELEHWAVELGYSSCILETGKRQPEAISLYLASGYLVVPNYGQYINVKTSVCMRKQITTL
jgi:putative acetyltransferase